MRRCTAKRLASLAGWYCMLALSWGSASIGAVRAVDPTPLLDPNASLIAHVNLKQVSVPKLMRSLTPILGKEMTQRLLPVQMTASALIGSLQRAGIDELYISLAIQDLSRQSPAIIIPTSRPDEAEQAVSDLLSMLPNKPELQFYRQEGMLIIAHPATWQRINDERLVQPSGVREHYMAHNDQLLSLTLGLNADLRSSVATVWPTSLPAEVPLSLSPRGLMRDIDALVLTVGFDDHLHLGLFVHCISEQAAQQIHAETKPQLAAVGVEFETRSRTLQLTLGIDQLQKLIGPLLTSGRAAADSSQASNNMKQLVLAMHNFHLAHQSLPPRMTVNTNSQPLLSWRVFLLPYLAEQALYDQFHLDEPWDSPHNKTLINKMPAVFADPTDNQGSSAAQGRTRLQVVLTPGSAWSGQEDRLLKFQDITDGTSNTICFVEVPSDQAVVWTQPVDFEAADVATAIARLLGDRPTIQAAYFDGSVRPASRESLPAHLTAAGREKE